MEEIYVRNCTLRGTLTGVRIKSRQVNTILIQTIVSTSIVYFQITITYIYIQQGGTGYARKISFEKIKLVDVNNPVIIDQFYCPSRVNCQNSVRRTLCTFFLRFKL